MCRCACHTRPDFVHRCGCKRALTLAELRQQDWWQQDVAAFRAQADMGRKVATLLRERAENRGPRCLTPTSSNFPFHASSATPSSKSRST